MNAHTSLLGVYEPGDGWLFRLQAGWKYLVMLVLTLFPLLVWQWWASLLALASVLAVMRGSGLRWRRILGLGWYLWLLLVLLAVYQLITAQPTAAFISPGNVLVAVLAARMLTLTTPTPALLDALSMALRPLGWIRLNPDTVALMIALMIRSIPFLAGAIADVRTAARARGMDRNPVLLLTPAVVSAVAYAQRTGEALHARGLPDRDTRP